MQTSVVILIFAHKPQLEWFEEISLRRCFEVLGTHPIRLVCPQGLDISAYRAIAPGLTPDFISPRWLSTVRAYNRLKISPFLYHRYSKFDYILTYELDAFVFRDELLEWCSAGWDYIGAPWFVGYHLATSDAAPMGVGNSGFSLRRTKTVLRILRSFRYQRPVGTVLRDFWNRNFGLRSTIAALTYTNNFFTPLNDFRENEDTFWCQVAARRFPDFRLASWDDARKFAFEANPSRLFRENGNRLPFGCHKWMTYEPEFWSEHIERFGYTIPAKSASVSARTLT